jgi:hypothetical protein
MCFRICPKHVNWIFFWGGGIRTDEFRWINPGKSKIHFCHSLIWKSLWFWLLFCHHLLIKLPFNRGKGFMQLGRAAICSMPICFYLCFGTFKVLLESALWLKMPISSLIFVHKFWICQVGPQENNRKVKVEIYSIGLGCQWSQVQVKFNNTASNWAEISWKKGKGSP